MIVKQVNPSTDFQTEISHDTLEFAGHRAEEQMAFYLRRAFGESEKIFVFNDLRLVRHVNGVEEVGQIDHLVMHRAGLVIVESKAVHDRVCVNERGEWSRTFGGRHQGMPSPIEQAKRQATFLLKFLNDHAPEITGKVFGLFQAYFGILSVDIIVAVSDSGIIERPKNLPLPEVCKADQVPGRIEELLALQRREAGFFSPVSTFSARRGRELSRAEMDSLIRFLPAQHRPVKAQADKSADRPVETISVPPPAKVSSPGTVSNAVGAKNVPLVIPKEICAVCGVVLSSRVAQFCREHEKRFQGRLLCFDHQRRGQAGESGRHEAPARKID